MEAIQAIEIDHALVEAVSEVASTIVVAPDHCICPKFGMSAHSENEACPSRKLTPLLSALSPRLSAIALGVESWLEDNKSFKIDTNNEYEQWRGKALGDLRGVKKTLDEVRLSITKEFRAAEESVNLLFRPLLGTNNSPGYIDQADKVISYATIDFENRRVAEKLANDLRAQEAAKKTRDDNVLHGSLKLLAAGKSEEAQTRLERGTSAPLPQIETPVILPAVSGGMAKAKVVFDIRDRHELGDKIWEIWKTLWPAIESARTILAASDCPAEVDDAMSYVHEQGDEMDRLFGTFGYLLALDESLVKQRVTSFGLHHGIPGVEAYEEKRVPARARR